MNDSYHSYNSVEFGWASEIPAHWAVARTKDLFSLERRPVKETDGVVTAFRDGQVTLRSNRRTDGFTNAIKETGYQGVRAGDLVIHNMDAFAGAIGISDSNGKSTPVYSVCSAKSDTHAPYFSALIRHIAISGYIQSLSRGIRERSSDFRWADSGCLSLPVPPRDEQIAIAAFLDHETGKIDGLIVEQERLIALLDEKRQAVISHAVTKGLDPNIEMRGSGVEWLGQVPTHWEVVPLKQVCTSNDEVLPESTLPEKEIQYIEISDVDSIEGIRSANTYKFHAAPSRARRIVREGDVLASTVRTYLRAIAPVSREYAGCIASTGFCVIRPHRCSAQYLGYAIRSEAFISDVISKSTGVSYPAINSTDLMRLKIAVPGSNEQEEIALYLGKATRKFDALSKEARSGISFLKERRSALISAAVTGKIDVRNHPAAIAALNGNKD